MKGPQIVRDPAAWNAAIESLPAPHLLQSWDWGVLKSRFGWAPYRLVWFRGSEEARMADRPGEGSAPAAAAQILVRAIRMGGLAARLAVVYAPKGPLLNWSDVPLRERVLGDMRKFALRKGGMFLKIDPDVRLGTGEPGGEGAWEDAAGIAIRDWLTGSGWGFSEDQIQFRNTVRVDLRASEDVILARMKQKTRYNVRLAGRRGVVVRVGSLEDLPLLYQMYRETSERDGFVIREERYYRAAWETFMRAGRMEPLVAEVEGEPVAGIAVFRFAGTATYMHGMSRAVHREKMPTYLLQWEAMRRAKAAGCTGYDLWGAPDVFDEGDSMWGVYRFKRGLGGEVIRTIGAYDYPLKPFWFRVYTQVLPRVLDVMRRRSRNT